MRTLTILLIFTLANIANAREEYPQLWPCDGHIVSTFTDQDTYYYESFLEFDYSTVMHTFVLLDGFGADDFERNTGLIGIILPIKKVAFGMGLGTNYGKGNISMFFLKYPLLDKSSNLLDVKVSWQVGDGGPLFKTEVNVNLLPLQIAFQHMSYYGFNAGLNLMSDDLFVGISYNFDHDLVQYTAGIEF
jgi:hypothetical protein